MTKCGSLATRKRRCRPNRSPRFQHARADLVVAAHLEVSIDTRATCGRGRAPATIAAARPSRAAAAAVAPARPAGERLRPAPRGRATGRGSSPSRPRPRVRQFRPIVGCIPALADKFSIQSRASSRLISEPPRARTSHTPAGPSETPAPQAAEKSAARYHLMAGLPRSKSWARRRSSRISSTTVSALTLRNRLSGRKISRCDSTAGAMRFTSSGSTKLCPRTRRQRLRRAQ